MNPYISRLSSNSPVLPISLLAVVAGFLVSVAWRTNDLRSGAGGRFMDEEQRTRLMSGPVGQQEQLRKQQEEIQKLRDQLTSLQNAVATETGQAKALNETLQEAKKFAGLTELVGPGVEVTLSDAPMQPSIDAPGKFASPLADEAVIHDKDVLKVVNELRAAGAEVIMVEDQRVVALTSFRCVGNTVLVNDQKYASPFRIRAIGSPKDLIGALKMPEGIYDELRSVSPNMIKIASVDKLVAPAYAGSTSFRYAKDASSTKAVGK
jgi:uncharacterized protein YlxW (UPF0749 family)